MPFTVNLNKININKLSVVFTWDDNESRQISLIAPLFRRYNIKCTFYVVPGENGFREGVEGYSQIANDGFEIGSHSFSHPDMTTLNNDEANIEFIQSSEEIFKSINFYPLSFAFPHHYSNETLIQAAKRYYLETRNTLNNSVRISIKTLSEKEALLIRLEEEIAKGHNVIFSGHSIITEEEFNNGGKGEGYEPSRLSLVESLLEKIILYNKNIEVITFCQAAIKEYIKLNNLYENDICVFDDNSLNYLQKLNIDRHRLIQLL
ncbi:MAG: hypothetical protein POELPBGB_04190 [Bacteroidia bacterium]|nr:hypothetical protein [Bacteroidia bacterium]